MLEKHLKLYSIAQFTFKIKLLGALVNDKNTSSDIWSSIEGKHFQYFMEVSNSKVVGGKKCLESFSVVN